MQALTLHSPFLGPHSGQRFHPAYGHGLFLRLAAQLSTNVQLMGTGPWLPFGNVTDDDLAAQARYHVVTFPHGIKVVRPELAYLEKCVAYRAKDAVDLRALHTQFAQQGAYHVRDLQANKSELILWDWKFLREMAQRIAQNPRAAKLIKQRCPLTDTPFSGRARGTVEAQQTYTEYNTRYNTTFMV